MRSSYLYSVNADDAARMSCSITLGPVCGTGLFVNATQTLTTLTPSWFIWVFVVAAATRHILDSVSCVPPLQSNSYYSRRLWAVSMSVLACQYFGRDTLVPTSPSPISWTRFYVYIYYKRSQHGRTLLSFIQSYWRWFEFRSKLHACYEKHMFNTIW